MLIEFSTITKNEAPAGAGGGIVSFGDNLTLTEVRSSIVAGNALGDVDFLSGGINSFQSSGYNVVGTGSALAKFNQPGDQANIITPLLGPLANHGGPTSTHALMAGSPALDKGDPGFSAPPDNDQRGPGFPRVQNGRIDIGAYEAIDIDMETDKPGKPPIQDDNWGMLLNGPAAPVRFNVQREFSIPPGGDGAIALAANWLESLGVALEVDLDIDGVIDFKLDTSNATPVGNPNPNSLGAKHPDVEGMFQSKLVPLGLSSATLNSGIWIVPIGDNTAPRGVRVSLTGGLSTDFLSWSGSYHGVDQGNPVGSGISTGVAGVTGSTSLAVPTVEPGNTTLDTLMALSRPAPFQTFTNMQPDPLPQDPGLISGKGEPQIELQLAAAPPFGFPQVADASHTPAAGISFRAAASTDDHDPTAGMTLMEWGFQPSGAAGFTHVVVELRHAPLRLGDYNGSGAVDAADYVVWRKTLGNAASPPFMGADGNGNGTIDPGDYEVWRANFGSAGSPAAASTTASAASAQDRITTEATSSVLSLPVQELEFDVTA